MTDPGRLFATYLRQQIEVGERAVVLPAPPGTLLGQERGAPADLERSSVDTQRPTAGGSPPAPTAPAESSSSKRGKRDWRDGAPDIPRAGIVIPRPDDNLFDNDPLAELDIDQLAETIRSCEACGLCEGRTHAVPGEGPADARLMVIGEGPGANEDQTGRPFVGRAGKLLDEILASIECPRDTVFICNIVKCRPPNNRNPETGEIDSCLPYLHRQISLVKPVVILAVGSVAAGTLLNSRGSLGSMRNKVHEFRGVPLIVTYHPAALLRNPQWKKPTWDDVRIARRLLD